MITPNDFFDEIFCLNLNRRADRWMKMNTRFQREGIHVTRFEGKDGVNKDVRIDYYLLKREKTNTRLRTIGAYAIILSYLKLLKMVMKQPHIKKVLIFEDDVLFHNEFGALFDDRVQKLPQNWEMWALAASQIGWNGVKYTDDRLFYSPSTKAQTYGLYAFALKREYIPTVISFLEKRIAPADVDIYRHHYNGERRIYISNPFLCAHSYGYSDNVNSMMDEKIASTKDWNHRWYDKDLYH